MAHPLKKIPRMPYFSFESTSSSACTSPPPLKKTYILNNFVGIAIIILTQEINILIFFVQIWLNFLVFEIPMLKCT